MAWTPDPSLPGVLHPYRVSPREIRRRLEASDSVPDWMIRVAEEKEAIAREYGEDPERITIFTHWQVY